MSCGQICLFAFALLSTPVAAAGGSKAVAFGDMRLGFSMTLGEAGCRGAAERRITQDEMESVAVEEKDDVRTVVWVGHATCGTGFAVTARAKKGTDGFWDYSFGYSEQSSGLDVLDVGFPALTVPYRKDSKVLRPYSQGMLVRLDWDSFGTDEELGRNPRG